MKSKILSPAQLQKKIRGLKQKKIVFTNGCFDILHAGHVTYLQKAKKSGDFLIVALNTDASVSELKGPSRPVNPLKDRALVMSALECVDAVTWFGEETPIKLIQKFTPHLLVKGGDYTLSTIVGADWVLHHGGKVKTIPLLKGRSTTAILKKKAAL